MGGVSMKTGKFSYISSNKYFDRWDTIKFLRMIRHQHRRRKLAVFWDNCSIHKTQEIKDEVRRLNIKLIHNVPYKPEYNGIELIWGKLKW